MNNSHVGAVMKLVGDLLACVIFIAMQKMLVCRPCAPTLEQSLLLVFPAVVVLQHQHRVCLLFLVNR